MHHRLAPKALDGSVHAGNTPVINLIKKHIECRLIKLNDVDTRRLQLLRFLINNACKLKGQRFTVFVVVIVKRIHHRHGTGQRPFDPPVSLRSQKLSILHKNRQPPFNRPYHPRNACVVSITDFDYSPLFKINAIKMLDKSGHEVLTGLFTVSDDINASQLLLL